MKMDLKYGPSAAVFIEDQLRRRYTPLVLAVLRQIENEEPVALTSAQLSELFHDRSFRQTRDQWTWWMLTEYLDWQNDEMCIQRFTCQKVCLTLYRVLCDEFENGPTPYVRAAFAQMVKLALQKAQDDARFDYDMATDRIVIYCNEVSNFSH